MSVRLEPVDAQDADDMKETIRSAGRLERGRRLLTIESLAARLIGQLSYRMVAHRRGALADTIDELEAELRKPL